MIKGGFFSAKGFSLIEMLVVAAILGFLGVVSATIISQILSSQNKTLVTNNVKQNGDYATQVFERDVRSAGIALVSPDPCTQNDCTLTLLSTSGATLQTWTCEDETATKRVLKRQLGGVGTFVAVTSSDDQSGTNIDTCAGIFDVNEDNENLVTIKFKLKSAVGLPDRPEFQASIDFILTVGMRSGTD